jgi:hypothetical protein
MINPFQHLFCLFFARPLLARFVDDTVMPKGKSRVKES